MRKRRPLRQRVRALSLLVSWLLFPLTIFYFSPYLIITAAAIGVINGSFIVFGLMLLAALVFGRAYPTDCAMSCSRARTCGAVSSPILLMRRSFLPLAGVGDDQRHRTVH